MDLVYIKVEDLNKWVAKYFKNKDLITVDDLIATIEDLDSEVDDLKEKLEQSENDKLENYRPIPVSEQYDMGECNFH